MLHDPHRLPRIKFIDPEILIIRKTIKIICAFYGYEQGIVLRRCKARQLVYVRNMIFYFTHYIKSIPAQKVGKVCGHDRSSVCRGVEKIKDKLQTDLNTITQFGKLVKKLGL